MPSQELGYGTLGGLVFAESVGVPVPGEAALVVAGLLAASGHLWLPLVLAIGTIAAISGDNVGYWLGRRFGREVLIRGPGPIGRHAGQLVARSERFYARHGAKAVFLGRWIAGVRIAAAVLAGAGRMRWRRFLLYNALGGFAWVCTVSGSAALLGPIVPGALYALGTAGLAVLALAAGLRALAISRRGRSRGASTGAQRLDSARR
ncbi:MAG: DedA family protein [Solirubrobacterales bacterium]|nr:DedA family protein [Solirubrobacterales bacterium]